MQKLWVAEVPSFEPCISYGDTMPQAMEMIQEAMEAVIESRTDVNCPMI
jgi:predicted RNase H-like HicB family nuclease